MWSSSFARSFVLLAPKGSIRSSPRIVGFGRRRRGASGGRGGASGGRGGASGLAASESGRSLRRQTSRLSMEQRPTLHNPRSARGHDRGLQAQSRRQPKRVLNAVNYRAARAITACVWHALLNSGGSARTRRGPTPDHRTSCHAGTLTYGSSSQPFTNK